jgi:hypothetical protein
LEQLAVVYRNVTYADQTRLFGISAVGNGDESSAKFANKHSPSSVNKRFLQQVNSDFVIIEENQDKCIRGVSYALLKDVNQNGQVVYSHN